MITRIEAWRYRCFKRLAVDVGPVNVLCGANGTGKTTLLDIPILLGDLVRERYKPCAAAFLEPIASRGVQRAHTLQELIFQGKDDAFVLAIEAKMPADVAARFAEARVDSPDRSTAFETGPTHLRYEVRFHQPDPTSIHVSHEYLFLFKEHRPPRADRQLQGDLLIDKPRVWLIQRAGATASYWKLARPLDAVIGRPRRVRPETIAVPLERLALASVPMDESSNPEMAWLTTLLTTESVLFEPDSHALRRASPPGQPKSVTRDGHSLVWMALRLAQGTDEEKERYARWVEHVRSALPQIENIRVHERMEDHYAYFEVQYRGGFSVTSSGLSDGTFRILTLTLLPYVTPRPRLLLTEEPETGIHPRAVEAVLQSLGSLYQSQVWFSTHSPVVLAHTDLAQILCARLGPEGEVDVIPGAKHPRLRGWKHDIDLGSLFAAGVLG